MSRPIQLLSFKPKGQGTSQFIGYQKRDLWVAVHTVRTSILISCKFWSFWMAVSRWSRQTPNFRIRMLLTSMCSLWQYRGFHSRGQHLCKFIGTKESVCIRKEFISHRTGLGHQHGRRFIVLGHQYGRRDVMWKHSIWVSSCLFHNKQTRIQPLSVWNWTIRSFSCTTMTAAKTYCCKLLLSYSNSFNWSYFGEFFWIGIAKDCIWVQKKKSKIVALCLHFP